MFVRKFLCIIPLLSLLILVFPGQAQQGNCNAPFTIGLNSPTAISFSNNSPTDLAEDHEECAGVPLDGRNNLLTFTAPSTGCYRFTIKQAAQLQSMVAFDQCPENSAASCLTSAYTYTLQGGVIESYNQDSASFNLELAANEEVFWLLNGEGNGSNFSVDAVVTRFTDEECATCSENTCVSCAGVSTETASIAGWRTYIGSFNNPKANGEVTPNSIINSPTTRHTVTSAGMTDPYAPISMNNPFTGRYSIRLGNQQVGAEAETMSYTYTVEPNSNFFTYYYAVVFQDPNHTPEEQPLFRVRVFREDGEEIECGFFESVAGDGASGFKPGFFGTLYKDWSVVTIPLVDFVGETITIEFTTRDCSRSGHFGYAYFDATCEVLNSFSEPSIVCEGDSAKLEAPEGFASYAWDHGPSGRITYVKEAGTYPVTMVTPTGCVYEDSVIVIYEPNPLFAGIEPVQACGDDEVFLNQKSAGINPTAVDTFYWKINGDSVGFGNLNWNYTGTLGEVIQYEFHYKTALGCNFSIKDSIPIFPDLTPVPQYPDTFYCIPDSVLYETPFQEHVTYNWSNGDSLHFSYYKTEGEGYLARTSGACYDSLTFLIAVGEFHPFDLPNDTILCWYDSLTLGTPETPDTRYIWNTGETTSFITIQDSGTYYLTNDDNGCTQSDTVTISLYRQAGVSLPPDTAICFGDSVRIGFADPKTHEWSTGEATDSITVKQEGYYTLSLVDAFCVEKDSIFVDTLTVPNPFTLSDSTICWYDSLLVGPNPEAAVNYQWNTAQQQAQIQLVDSGQFYLTAERNGCIVSDTMHLAYHRQAFVTLPNDTTICVGDTIQVGFEDSKDHIWNTGATTPYIDIFSAGWYKLTLNDAFCTESDSIFVSTSNPPEFDLGNDTTICLGTAIPLELQFNYPVTYLWNTGSRKPNITAEETGEYILTVTDSLCSFTDNKFVTTNTPIIDYNTYAQVLCLSDTLVVDLFCTNCSFLPSNSPTYSDTIFIGDSLQFYTETSLGCPYSEDFIVELDRNCDYDLYVPNAFSPNGDGTNDFFKPISYTPEIAEYTFIIHNRWGEQLFATDRYEDAWDGRFRGNLVKPNTYVWMVTLRYKNLPDSYRYKGTVTVLR